MFQNNSRHKDKSGQIDLTDVEESNSWLIGGGTTGASRGHHGHCGETVIAEGSWTTPADPTWIPEEIVSREDGKNFFQVIAESLMIKLKQKFTDGPKEG
jgi:hypothetical protein